MKHKRYVLLETQEALTAFEIKEFTRDLEVRFGKLKVIPVEGSAKALVVKADDHVASLLRREVAEVRPAGKAVAPVLTSGSIGKLKRRASGTSMTGLG